MEVTWYPSWVDKQQCNKSVFSLWLFRSLFPSLSPIESMRQSYKLRKVLHRLSPGIAQFANKSSMQIVLLWVTKCAADFICFGMADANGQWRWPQWFILLLSSVTSCSTPLVKMRFPRNSNPPEAELLLSPFPLDWLHMSICYSLGTLMNHTVNQVSEWPGSKFSLAFCARLSIMNIIIF